MTELNYEVPVVGEKHQASDPRVTTALTEIRTVLNGRLTANNFAKETLTPKKFPKLAKWTSTAFGTNLLGNEKFEIAASSQNRSIALTLFFEGGLEALAAVSIKVGETVVAKAALPGIAQTGVIPVGPFRVPANESVAIEMPAPPGQIGGTSTYSTLTGVA